MITLTFGKSPNDSDVGHDVWMYDVIGQGTKPRGENVKFPKDHPLVQFLVENKRTTFELKPVDTSLE